MCDLLGLDGLEEDMLAGGGRTVPTPSTESRDRADSGPQGRDERCTSSLLKAETAASDFRSSGALPTEVQLPTPLATGSSDGTARLWPRGGWAMRL